jgi:hypothetical protein
MKSSTKVAPTGSKQVRKAPAESRGVKSPSARVKQAKKSATNIAIATELAPAVAIALLEKTKQSPDDAAPALDCLAAGAVASHTGGKVRVQLLFENGAVLPVEMSVEAGAALSKGLADALPEG